MWVAFEEYRMVTQGRHGEGCVCENNTLYSRDATATSHAEDMALERVEEIYKCASVVTKTQSWSAFNQKIIKSLHIAMVQVLLSRPGLFALLVFFWCTLKVGERPGTRIGLDCGRLNGRRRLPRRSDKLAPEAVPGSNHLCMMASKSYEHIYQTRKNRS